MAADKRRPVSIPDKQKVVDLHKDGHSNGEIAGRIRRSVSLVQRIVAQYKSTGAIISPPKTGRPRKTSVKQDRLMVSVSGGGKINKIGDQFVYFHLQEWYTMLIDSVGTAIQNKK